MKWATNIGRKNLISMGVCVGKFTKSKKFHMQITALDVIQSYSKVHNIRLISNVVVKSVGSL